MRKTTQFAAFCITPLLFPYPALAADDGLAWAVNIGGPAYKSVDGTSYEAESAVHGGTVGRISQVKGSQDPELYRTFRTGDVRVTRPLQNGTYDITFHFAEPGDVAAGERVFDAFVEGERVMDDVDVMLFRDGKVRSALSVTVPGVSVTDGELNVHFDASVGEPVLSALVVRNRQEPSPGWELVWQDEFDGNELDASKWSPNIWPARKVNDEDQAYTGRKKNLRVEEGMLVIEAHREDYQGASYTSGRVHSAGKGDFLYGRFEVRARLPRGQGTWPAIWMLPSDPYRYSTTCKKGEDWQGSATCNAWPNSGEIDIMEHVGYQMNHVHGTVHNEAYYWVKWEQRKGRILLDGVDEQFHVYSLEWSPERIDIFVDDAHYFTYMNEGTGWNAWPYDHPFHLILNIAVGGAWGRAGGPIDDSIFPQRMLVDYVRVYQKAGE
jgi:beta-glucanase (GH16 family)